MISLELHEILSRYSDAVNLSFLFAMENCNYDEREMRIYTLEKCLYKIDAHTLQCHTKTHFQFFIFECEKMCVKTSENRVGGRCAMNLIE